MKFSQTGNCLDKDEVFYFCSLLNDYSTFSLLKRIIFE